MCGIAGYFLRNGAAETAPSKRCATRSAIAGRTMRAFYVDGGCGIGMRRLSIIDLTTGHQPISNEDGSVWIVFNGEIYNYQELRADLIARGHRFRTHSDTETHRPPLRGGGRGGLSRSCAACSRSAIWDARKRKLLLARDRFGKKPLYYAVLPEGIYFGSELKCLRAAGVPLETDREALRLYFQFTYIPDPFTAFRGDPQAAAGSWLTMTSRAASARALLAIAGPGRRARAGSTREARCAQCARSSTNPCACA